MAKLNKENQFWGTGWSFPPTFDKGNYQLKVVKDEENINQSIDIILNTYWGERSMMPFFGSNLNTFSFKKINATTEGEIIDSVKSSILNYEPRITLNEVDIIVSEEDGTIFVHITYTVKHTNSRHNHVYPFYLTEATNLNIKHFEDRIK